MIEFLMLDGDGGGNRFVQMRAANRARNERHMPAFKAWLADRLRMLTGRDDWQSVRFERLEPLYDPDADRIIDAEGPTATYVVTLP
jgi:hypothetical protein